MADTKTDVLEDLNIEVKSKRQITWEKILNMANSEIEAAKRVIDTQEQFREEAQRIVDEEIKKAGV